VRAYETAHLAELEARVIALAKDIERQRGVSFQLGARASAEVAPSDPAVFAKLTNCAKLLGVPSQPLVSPASHDTATFTRSGVPSAMLFVRNANGSHNPDEAMEIDDFLQAAAVLTHFIAAETAGE
jgi:beta-ureidopropionase / N-carbamoyl-L-amino-acid hydrolase